MSRDPGLDLDQLRGIRGRQRLKAGWGAAQLERIAQHLDEHDGFVAWSGGKDSTAVVDLARQVDPHIPVVVYDSGLLFPETISYIRQLTERWQLNLHRIKAEPDLLTMLAAGGGFNHDSPDQPLIGKPGDILITEPARRAHEQFGNGSMWGVRSAEEPAGRAHLYRTALAAAGRAHPELTAAEVRARFGGTVERLDGTVTYGPIWDWSTPQVFEYLRGRGIEPNPLYRKLEAVGAPAGRIRVDSILDAGHLAHGEMAWLQKGWPTLFDRLAEVLPRLREWT